MERIRFVRNFNQTFIPNRFAVQKSLTMMFYKVGVVFLTYLLGVASCRDSFKSLKNLPTISNSLVNFGKMDVAIHLDTKHPLAPLASEIGVPDLQTDHRTIHKYSSKAESLSTPKFAEEPCPCSGGITDLKTSLSSNPSDILNTILKSNDLFTFNEEPHTSMSCCESYENINDEVIFDVDHEQGTDAEMNSKPHSSFPFILDRLLSNNKATPIKQKVIEIFFWPKVDDSTKRINFKPLSYQKKPYVKKSDIKIVGDKELKNDFKYMKLKTLLPNPLPRFNKEDKQKDLKNGIGKSIDHMQGSKQTTLRVKEAKFEPKGTIADKELNFNAIMDEVIQAAKMPNYLPEKESKPIKNEKIIATQIEVTTTKKPNSV